MVIWKEWENVPFLKYFPPEIDRMPEDNSRSPTEHSEYPKILKPASEDGYSVVNPLFVKTTLERELLF